MRCPCDLPMIRIAVRVSDRRVSRHAGRQRIVGRRGRGRPAGIIVGKNAVVGAGTVVTKTFAGPTVVGNPVRPSSQVKHFHYPIVAPVK